MKYLYTISTILCVSLYAQETVEDSSVVEDTIKLSTKSIENSGLTQEQIVKLDEQTRILLADYQSTSKEYDSLKLYNDQVQKIINSQIDEIENIILKIDEFYFKCCIGKGGLSSKKTEGDKKTPIGVFKIENLY